LNLRIAKPPRSPNPDAVDPTKVRPLQRRNEFPDVWMSNIRVDTARVLDVKGGRFGDSLDGASAGEDAPPEA